MLTGPERRTTVLLTGFGPFPGVPVNASADLVRRAARKARVAFPNVRVAAAILPTEWERAPRLVARLHERHRPALALHFGVASGSKCIRLEAEARNFCRDSLDVAGASPCDPRLSADGPATRLSSIAVPRIAAALAAKGYPSSISEDAGGYLCNAVLYHSLAIAEARGGCRVGFVHIPSDLAEPPLGVEDVTAAALEIIRIALETIPVAV
ncbi:pyroglutamyl-peptidase I [Hyphomicrobium sp.]|uniref:pyroglutamyl-peptidase I family protein n=1 Tax=Hyphomicrobium sp. TaxID=82 RepID=UPI000FB65FF7|nr:pyroglutamyl-peptidase I [Hyphomicrobium sp.]RUP08133.1 MAG: pyroglutamyl-peptidase I [Hyphomicrobium sp.]